VIEPLPDARVDPDEPEAAVIEQTLRTLVDDASGT